MQMDQPREKLELELGGEDQLLSSLFIIENGALRITKENIGIPW